MRTSYTWFVITLVLQAAMLAGCSRAITATTTPEPTVVPTSPPATATVTPPPTASSFDASKYAFPETIDPARRYLFYIHGRIIEDQGIPAVDPTFGEYQYQAILEKLAGYGFVVLSEVRSKDTDSMSYARIIASQIRKLLQAGVPAQNVTVVGASKGAGINIFVSNLLGDPEINYVLLAICEPGFVKDLVESQISLSGNVLSIYDSNDPYGGTCQDLFAFSEGKGLARHDEIVLNLGLSHGLLYRPLDEWVLPTIEWAGGL
jgi:hypothetical protein